MNDRVIVIGEMLWYMLPDDGSILLDDTIVTLGDGATRQYNDLPVVHACHNFTQTIRTDTSFIYPHLLQYYQHVPKPNQQWAQLRCRVHSHLPAPSECEHGGDLPGNRIRHDYGDGAKLEPVGHVLHGASQGSRLG